MFAGVCDSWSYSNGVDGSIVPTKTGKYYAIDDDNTYSNGEPILKGNSYEYTRWEDNFWYNTHWISCKVKDIEPKSEYNRVYEKYESCYLITLYCDVSERTQFYKDDVKSINVPIAPLLEQQEIASYLDKRCAQIDASISKAQREIELLQEYKQSLITEVVTGKRKVC